MSRGKSRVSSKGQITIPTAVRKRLGLRPGTVVEFEPREDGVLLRKGWVAEHPVDRVFGLLAGPRQVDALRTLDRMRGARPGGRRAKRR